MSSNSNTKLRDNGVITETKYLLMIHKKHVKNTGLQRVMKDKGHAIMSSSI